MMPGMPFEQGQVTLEAGDCLVVYSDGVTEATNAAGALFDETALDSAIKAMCGRAADAAAYETSAATGSIAPGAGGNTGTGAGADDHGAAERILHEVVERVDQFASGADQADDISLMVVRRSARN